jgi:hypothetical protein
VGHVTYIWEIRNTYRILMRKPEGKIPLRRLVPYIHGRIILNYILKKQDRRAWIGLIWLWLGISGGLLWTW